MLVRHSFPGQWHHTYIREYPGKYNQAQKLTKPMSQIQMDVEIFFLIKLVFIDFQLPPKRRMRLLFGHPNVASLLA